MYRNEFSNNEKEENVLFEEKEFSEIHRNARESLRLMANCVILTNATILKERNLVPEKFFHEYPVYGSVKGYAVNRETPEGQKLAEKLEACLEPIHDQLLHKLAIVVEETLHTQPVEAFIWNFSYDSTSMDASAEIGYGSQRSKFTVNYKNMQDTCQQFCKLFSKLQDILKGLQPLPEGMIPSMKIAFRGDPEFVPGFHSINEFVSLEQVHQFDAVAFPHNGLQLSFASQFMSESNAPPIADIYEPAYVGTDLSNSISDEHIEAPRHDTMGNENTMAGENLEGADIHFDDFIDASMNCNPAYVGTDLAHPISDEHIEAPRHDTMDNENIMADENLEGADIHFDDFIDASMNCNPNNVTNSDERRVLHSEFAMAVNNIPPNESFEKSPRKAADTPKMTVENKRVATDDLNTKDPMRKTKKRKDSVKSVFRNGPKYGKTANMNLSKPQKNSDTGINNGPIDRDPQNFARVPSILSILEGPVSATEPPSRQPKFYTTRYGRVSSVLDTIEPVKVELQDVPIELSKKYGRVRSLKVIVEQQSKMYGQTHSLVREK